MTVIALVVLAAGVLTGVLLRSLRWIAFAVLVALLLLSPVGFLAVLVVLGGAALLLIN